jgi:hypothetical protein
MEAEKETHSLWDKLFKIIGNYYPEELLRFVCSSETVKYEEHYEQEKVVLEYQIADINLWIRDGNVKKLLNIEPYTTWNDSIPAVVFTRNGLITKNVDYEFEVLSIAVLLEKTQREGLYQVFLEGKALNSFRFPVISFTDIERILKEFPPLAPLVLKVDPRYQKEVLKIVKGSKLLKAITVLVLNKLGKSQEEALKMTGAKLEEWRDALLEVPMMKDLWEETQNQAREEGLEKGREEGLEKGLEKGRGNQLKECIVTGLEYRFKKVSAELKEEIYSLHDLKVLASLFEKSYHVETLKEFKKVLHSLLKKTP